MTGKQSGILVLLLLVAGVAIGAAIGARVPDAISNIAIPSLIGVAALVALVWVMRR